MDCSMPGFHHQLPELVQTHVHWVSDAIQPSHPLSSPSSLLTKVCLIKAIVIFSSSHVWMWELDHKEGWGPKNWRFWTVVLEKTFESPLNCKELKPVNPKGNQSWIGRADADIEAPVLWPPDTKSWLTAKDFNAGKDPGQEEKGNDRGWDGRMASPTQGTWIWVDSGSWWWTGRPGMLRFMGSRRVRHDWATELNRTELKSLIIHCSIKKVKNYWCFHPSHTLPKDFVLIVMGCGQGIRS